MGITLDIMRGRGSRAKRSKPKRRKRSESIDMRARRHGYFPKIFIWRGHKYRVRAVERCWTVSRRGRSGRVEQHRFRVRCREGTFEVYQNIQHNTWHIQRPAS